MARLAIGQPGVVEADLAPIVRVVAIGALSLEVVGRSVVARLAIVQAGVAEMHLLPVIGTVTG